MRHIIAGTAGHIDHGKTALTRALTGIDTDRLEEEKRRGISIDLGFAHMELGGGIAIGLVDVPGHERFVRNMLAGAGGIDLVLLIISAEESIKPQTREHFDICRLLGIQTGVVVLTKADLVDPDLIELVRLEAEDFVKGSFLEGAPIVAVSAKTGAGIEQLKQALATQALRAAQKSTRGHFRLPVDRAFAMKGFGAVVTGTLISGTVRPEQEVEAQPGGQRLRVRGVQVHGKHAILAHAGQRTALNISGAETSELPRGIMLVEPGCFHASSHIACEIDLLSSAKPLKDRAPVHFHSFTAETEAEVRLLESSLAAPGRRAIAILHLRDPILLLPGDRFIIRMFSPVVTIGGGRVLDIAPPPRLRRAKAAARTARIASASRSEFIELLVCESAAGCSLESLVSRTGMTAADVQAAVLQPSLVWLPAHQYALSRPWMTAWLDRVHEVVAQFHRANPLLRGISKQELRSRELPDAPAFLMDEVLAHSKTLATEGDLLRLVSHKLQFKQDEESAVNRIVGAFEKAGLAVPAWKDVLASCGVEPARSRSLLQILLKDGRLVRVSEDLLFHRSAIQDLRSLLARRKGQSFGVSEFKDWTGASRKYAIPLLEYLDRERVTRRDGDSRVVL